MEDVQEIIDTFCSNKGLEASPYKLKWYNSALTNDKFRMDFAPEDSLAFVIISQPCMFEKAFLPYIKDHWEDILNNTIQDPLDQCMKHTFECLKQELTHLDHDLKAFHDFELGPASRRPKILVQTAAHVSGAVRFYQKVDANPAMLQEEENGKVFPVCLHPKFGGWFAIRGAFIFPNIPAPQDLIMKNPPEILQSPDEVSDLLNLYNLHWRDNRFRNCGGNIEEQYSASQQTYFSLKPGPERISYLAKLLDL